MYEAGKQAKVDQYGSRAIFANLIRNDFMLHCEPGQDYKDASIFNVEINTIASSFGVLSNQICTMHRHVYGSLNRPDVVAAVPENNTRSNLVMGFKVSHACMQACVSHSALTPCVPADVSRRVPSTPHPDPARLQRGGGDGCPAARD